MRCVAYLTKFVLLVVADILMVSGLTVQVAEKSSADLDTALQQVHVVYGSDSGSFDPLLHSMISLGEHLKDPASCTIHLIVPKGDMGQAAELAQCFRNNWNRADAMAPKVELHQTRPLTFDVGENGFWPQLKGKATVFTRFTLPEYLPDLPRALWIDTDTIVRKDVAELYRMPMTAPLAAKFEAGTWQNYISMKPSLASVVHNSSEHIFNSGVMLYDLPRWRAESATEALAQRMKDLGHLGVDDQFVLNKHFRNRVDHLDARWNLEGLGCWLGPNDTQIDSGFIVHWSGADKPWKGHGARQDIFHSFAPREICAALL